MTNKGCLRMRTVVWIVIIALLLFSLFIIRKVLNSSETWECNVSRDSITDKVEADYLIYHFYKGNSDLIGDIAGGLGYSIAFSESKEPYHAESPARQFRRPVV